MSLTGDLAEIAIGEIIQTLSMNAHEGTLRIRAPSGEKLFYLSKGDAQLIVPGKKATRIGEALVRTRRISQEQLEKALTEHTNSGKILGRMLVELGYCDESDIEEIIRQQFRDEFFEVFLLEKGNFEFMFNIKPDRLVSFDEEMSRVSLNTSSLMMEALRQIDEWKQMTEEIRSSRAIFQIEGDVNDAVQGMSVAEEGKTAVLLIDGRRPLEDVVRESGATKFDVYSVVFELTKQGLARALTHEECREKAYEAEGKGQTYDATVYYEYGLFLETGDIEMRERQFKLLKRLTVYEEARVAALAAADLHADEGRDDQALTFYLEAQAIDSKDLRAAEGVFRCCLKLNKEARALKTGDEFVKLAIRNHDLARAHEALVTLLGMDADGYQRRVLLGDVYAEERNKKEALAQYELALDGWGKDPSKPEVGNVCRKILSLDEARDDVRVLLKGAVAVEEKRAKQKMIKTVLSTVGVILLMCGVVWGVQEWSARTEIADAMAIAREDAAVPQAIERLKWVAQHYKWTTVRASATDLVKQLQKRAEDRLAAEKKHIEDERNKDKEKLLQARREAVMELLRHARTMERKESWKEASDTYFQVLHDYADVSLDQKIFVPIEVTGIPPGASVRRGNDDLGVTPLILHAEPLKEMRLQLVLAGYAAFETSVKVDRYEAIHATLERAPVWTNKGEGAIDVTPAVAGGRIFVAARDGTVRAVDAEKGTDLWRSPIGEWGDALSPPAAIAGKVFVGTSDGRVLALDSGTGKPLYQPIDAGGAVRSAPRTSADGFTVAIGASNGVATFFRTASGERLFGVKTEHRIDASIAFDGGIAYVGSRDGKLYAVSIDTGALRWTFPAGDDILGEPAATGDLVVFGARDGHIYGVSRASGTEVWRLTTAGRVRAAPIVDGASVLCGSEDGKLLFIDAKSGKVARTYDAGAPILASPAIGAKSLYVMTSDGTITALERESLAVRWRYSLKCACYASPIVLDGKVIIAGTDGTVRALLE